MLEGRMRMTNVKLATHAKHCNLYTANLPELSCTHVRSTLHDDRVMGQA